MEYSIDKLKNSVFENIKLTNEINQEYWSARDLFVALAYNDWRNFGIFHKCLKVVYTFFCVLCVSSFACLCEKLIIRHFTQSSQRGNAKNAKKCKLINERWRNFVNVINKAMVKNNQNQLDENKDE